MNQRSYGYQSVFLFPLNVALPLQSHATNSIEVATLLTLGEGQAQTGT